MKKIFVSTILLLIISISFAQKPASKGVKAADIYFEDVAAEFGTIEEGESKELVFTFFNSGTAPLLLKNVKPACGCTTPEWPKQPIMPGKKGEIKATFNSKGYGGQNIHKSITVTTNVPENGNDKVIILYIKGFVKK
ncbi:MAG: DUF1573 domain-containing protein [Bacteroidetes bacterium]|jgi:hypothetical protein|nr:DUF1573 domain-containing protein [Bacteroidota bacterium]MBT5528752.1 DUF1573 domain-containing protein [Cytophagia bacterium]MBT3802883.1 DUF1573 domain-containing protein [Bacteroidota bacterium]MBT4729270.1 DUF1573 domain-containing protein [Bacteroidota bacterium]MBT5991763.1 DUF1573 domain-containing protein [Bacteroidota bacterium]